jgi:hypothetical protein
LASFVECTWAGKPETIYGSGFESKEQNWIIFKHRAGEVAGSECAGTQIDATTADIGLAYGSMTLNHEFPKLRPSRFSATDAKSPRAFWMARLRLFEIQTRKA